MTDLLKFRKGFPVLSQYTYLNTAAWGPMHEDLHAWRGEQELDFLVGGSDFKIDSLSLLDQVRERIGVCFGCSQDRIALVPNFSLGLNMLLDGLPKQSRVVLLEGDYPSLNWPFEDRPFQCRHLPADTRVEERILESLRAEPAEVLAISLVQWINGLLISPEFLATLKEEFPGLLIVADATQYLGAFDLDFDASVIDVLGASGYKWMLGGNGNGFLLLSEEATTRFHVRTIGFQSVFHDPRRRESVSLAQRLEPGHLDTLSFGSLWFGLGLLQEVGLDRVEAYNRELWGKVLNALDSRGLLAPGIAGRPVHSGIFSIPNREGWFDALGEQGVVCSQRGGGIRLSFHCYNTDADLQTVLEVLDQKGNR
ncbi:aminotransferase class V-fold PLP-dependent enzyme [Robiginitalea sediminis]|uniref:aminotransferase class V-fold PLP-dependent enzyme n=1 Tax=Robiginitalea sediminis TaxID=1982593 RepID=UPI000B4B0745|nr:aminotransferase class V-fold PLP-dependent enzyme [Robiginitalea sediminis]